MRETGRGNGGSGQRAHDSPAAPCRAAAVTEGSQEPGRGQGAVGAAGGIRTGRAQGPDRRHPG